MSKNRKRLPAPVDPGVTWLYYVSRDSVNGELAGVCHLWWVKPLRTRVGSRVTWVGADGEPGHIGEYPLPQIVNWFGAERVPENDIQLFKIEMGVTQKMLDNAEKPA